MWYIQPYISNKHFQSHKSLKHKTHLFATTTESFFVHFLQEVPNVHERHRQLSHLVLGSQIHLPTDIEFFYLHVSQEDPSVHVAHSVKQF